MAASMRVARRAAWDGEPTGESAESRDQRTSQSAPAARSAAVDATGAGEWTERAAAADAAAASMRIAARAALAGDGPASDGVTMRKGHDGAREEHQRAASIKRASVSWADEETSVPDVLQPDVFDSEEPDSTAFITTGLRQLIISDETGTIIDWPWETGPTGRRTGGKRRRHRLDDVICRGLFHAYAKGGMGENSPGVKRWKAFCAEQGTTPHRPMDPNTPLKEKLTEEWFLMRFVASLADDHGLQISSVATYVGQVQGWHAKAHGIKLAAGLSLQRLPAMVKGLRRTSTTTGRRVRRGVSPEKLRRAMDRCFWDLDNLEHATMRAALSLALQGLLRGAEFAADGARWEARKAMTREDIAVLSLHRLVVMMRPCKNMQALSGKTVPLVIGAGGKYIDAVAEMHNMLRVDPTPAGMDSTTPLFRQFDVEGRASPLTTNRVREWTRALMISIDEDPAQFGTHSYRIGGATSLFAAGADPIIIRTMGRWSSDCYRLYVRACFNTTLDWTARCGSQIVDDVAGEFEEVDCY